MTPGEPRGSGGWQGSGPGGLRSRLAPGSRRPGVPAPRGRDPQRGGIGLRHRTPPGDPAPRSPGGPPGPRSVRRPGSHCGPQAGSAPPSPGPTAGPGLGKPGARTARRRCRLPVPGTLGALPAEGAGRGSCASASLPSLLGGGSGHRLRGKLALRSIAVPRPAARPRGAGGGTLLPPGVRLRSCGGEGVGGGALLPPSGQLPSCGEALGRGCSADALAGRSGPAPGGVCRGQGSAASRGVGTASTPHACTSSVVPGDFLPPPKPTVPAQPPTADNGERAEGHTLGDCLCATRSLQRALHTSTEAGDGGKSLSPMHGGSGTVRS